MRHCAASHKKTKKRRTRTGLASPVSFIASQLLLPAMSREKESRLRNLIAPPHQTSSRRAGEARRCALLPRTLIHPILSLSSRFSFRVRAFTVNAFPFQHRCLQAAAEYSALKAVYFGYITWRLIHFRKDAMAG